MPNSNYCAFEDWVVPILHQMTAEQQATPTHPTPMSWAPSDVIHRLGKEINDESSVYYWCYKVQSLSLLPIAVFSPVPPFSLPLSDCFFFPSPLLFSSSPLLPLPGFLLSSLSPHTHTHTHAPTNKNNIPVFCPALTDGSLGDMLYFHSYKTATPLIIDIVKDIRRLNDMSVKAKRAGMIVLGGGVCKHQIANAMLFVRPSPPSPPRLRHKYLSLPLVLSCLGVCPS